MCAISFVSWPGAMRYSAQIYWTGRSDVRRKIGYQGEQNGLSESGSGINLQLKLSFRRGTLRNPLRVYCGETNLASLRWPHRRRHRPTLPDTRERLVRHRRRGWRAATNRRGRIAACWRRQRSGSRPPQPLHRRQDPREGSIGAKRPFACMRRLATGTA